MKKSRFTQAQIFNVLKEYDNGPVRIVASRENPLRKAQRGTLGSGELADSGPGHAEVTLLNFAKNNSLFI